VALAAIDWPNGMLEYPDTTKNELNLTNLGQIFFV